MTQPLKKKNPMATNDSNTTRIAVLETTITHIHETLERMDKRLDHFDNRFDRLDNRIWNLMLWTLGGFAGILIVMAKGFHWL